MFVVNVVTLWNPERSHKNTENALSPQRERAQVQEPKPNLLANLCGPVAPHLAVDTTQTQLKILGSDGGAGSSVGFSLGSSPGFSPGLSPGFNLVKAGGLQSTQVDPGWRWPLSDVWSWCPGGGHVTVAAEHLSLLFIPPD